MDFLLQQIQGKARKILRKGIFRLKKGILRVKSGLDSDVIVKLLRDGKKKLGPGLIGGS